MAAAIYDITDYCNTIKKKQQFEIPHKARLKIAQFRKDVMARKAR